MKRNNLNNLYFYACNEYTMYLITGNKRFKEKALYYFSDYKKNGGKKKLKAI